MTQTLPSAPSVEERGAPAGQSIDPAREQARTQQTHAEWMAIVVFAVVLLATLFFG